MPDFLKKIIENLKNFWNKITLVQKLIAGGVLLAAVIVVVLVVIFTSNQAGTPLFASDLSIDDFGRITKKLEEDGVSFKIKNKSIILVKNKTAKNKTIMKLAQDGLLPSSGYGYKDIIGDKRMTSSKFIDDMRLRAALEGELEKLLSASEIVYSADVTFTNPQEKIWTSERNPVKVAVVLTPAYNIELRDPEYKKSIKGIQEIIENSIDGATPENIVITDNYSFKLNDFTFDDAEADIRKTVENLKIRDEMIRKYTTKIHNAINRMLPEDRFSLVVNVEMNFDKLKESRKEILPVVLKKDNPETPYDDGERRYSIIVSSSKTNETFTGPNWIPEGPPGFDQNVPPGYEGALEQITEYVKDNVIENHVYGESNIDLEKDPWEIMGIKGSIMVDGTWSIEYDENKKPVIDVDGSRKRIYTPPGAEELKSLKAFVEQAIGYDISRNDKVVVTAFAKDRSAEFKAEDDKWKRKRQIMWALLAGILSILLLVIIAVVYRAVAKEIERRKRLREEELARKHQLAREMALKGVEDEGVETEMSEEERARLELQETAINIAREHPEDVAQLIRTWLSEE